MSRTLANVPLGVDGLTQFPIYEYDKQGDRVASNQWFDDALEHDCEKAFVVIVTDGQSSRDDFDQDPTDTALGFANFGNLIGDYHADGEVEAPGDPDEPTYYLDDIAKYMYDHDFRPDLDGDPDRRHLHGRLRDRQRHRRPPRAHRHARQRQLLQGPGRR